jgi:hypothetical protein
LLQPYKGSSYGSGNSGNPAPDGHTNETQNQLSPSEGSDLVLRDFSIRETSLEYIVLDSPPVGTKDPSRVKTIITVEDFPSVIEGQSAISAGTGGSISTDKLVSPHHFEDAMMATSFWDPEVNFDYKIE